MIQHSRILVIDDEPVLRKTLARILKRNGFEETITAANAGEGISMIAAQEFDLICLDIRLPDMSGLEALKTIRSIRPELPVILFTAQPDLTSAMQAVRLDAADYLLKPIKPEILLKRAKEVLERTARERRKREIQSQIETWQAELKKLEDGEAPIESTIPPMIQPVDDRFLSRGKLTLDIHARRVMLGEQTTSLPPATFDYLLVLARHAPHVVDFQTLVVEAQGYETNKREAQILSKWHIHYIRQAIESNGQHPAFVINVRGHGYRLVID